MHYCTDSLTSHYFLLEFGLDACWPVGDSGPGPGPEEDAGFLPLFRLASISFNLASNLVSFSLRAAAIWERARFSSLRIKFETSPPSRPSDSATKSKSEEEIADAESDGAIAEVERTAFQSAESRVLPVSLVLLGMLDAAEAAAEAGLV